MERDWTSELEAYLQIRFAELCETIGQPVPLTGLRISPALATEESKYFLLGLEEGLFRFGEEGCAESELFHASTEENSASKMCQIFWHDPPPPRLFREGICQLATASLLILKRGWLKSQVRLEPRENRAPAHGGDIRVRSLAGELLVCVIVKRSAAELEKLVTDLRACCKRGAHAKDDCGFPQNHPNYEFCALSQPPHVWAVAPEADICLRMSYRDGQMELDHLSSLPPRSMIDSR
jgi:hypothetical protein